jgi:chemosensory pili system protein ChpC
VSEPAELACVLARLHDRQLLLPNVAVAEVVRMQRIRPVKTTPDWHLGMLPWRGRILPVVSPERIYVEPDTRIPPLTANCAMLVMNRTRVMKGLEFYALLVRALPRMLWVASEDLAAVDGPLDAGEAGRVMLGEDEVVIPSLPYLEELVVQHKLTPKAA